MAYTPRTIKDRVAVGDDIFLVEDLGNNRIKLTPTPTHVSEAGTPVNKALLQHMENHLFPPGGIIMWSGAINDIPVGWALCDGSNGTPNLRDRFVVGAGGSYNPGNTGGMKDVTLTTSQLPEHTHTGSSDRAGDHRHGMGTRWAMDYDAASSEVTPGSDGPGFTRKIIEKTTGEAGAHFHTFTVDNTGSGEPHENRPPYYALAYIMKL